MCVKRQANGKSTVHSVWLFGESRTSSSSIFLRMTGAGMHTPICLLYIKIFCGEMGKHHCLGMLQHVTKLPTSTPMVNIKHHLCLLCCLQYKRKTKGEKKKTLFCWVCVGLRASSSFFNYSISFLLSLSSLCQCGCQRFAPLVLVLVGLSQWDVF